MLLTLTKHYLFGSFYSGKRRGQRIKSAAARLLLGIFALLYVTITFGAMFGGIFYLVGSLVYHTPLQWIYYAFVALVCSGFALLGSVILCYTSLYRSKDNSILGPLPIKNSTILAARFISVYLGTALFVAPFALASAIVCMVFFGSGAIEIIRSLFAALMFPLPAMFLALILCFLLAFAIKLAGRYGKILQSILGVAAFIIYLIAVNSISGAIDAISSKALVQLFNGPLIFFAILGKAVNGDLLSFVISLLIFFALFYLSFLFMGKSYGRLTQGSFAHTSKKNSSGPLTLAAGPKKFIHRLISLDLSRLISEPSILLNATSGILMSLFLVVSLALRLSSMSELSDLMSYLPQGMLVSLFCTLLAAPSTFSILPSVYLNVSADELRQLRSLPVSSTDLVFSKLIVSLIIALPAPLIFAIGGALFMPEVFLDLSILLPGLLFGLSFTIFTQSLSLLLNLYRIRLDLDPIVAMKRSMNSLFHVLITGGLLAIFSIMTFNFQSDGNWLVYLVASLILLGLTGAVHVQIKNCADDRIAQALGKSF